MNKLYFLFCLLTTPIFSLGQTVPSGDFENWAPSTFHKLDSYQSSNGQSLPASGTENVFRTTDSYAGNYAVRLETILNGPDTIPGYFLNGDINTGTGGVPYSENPDSLTGYFKCDVQPGDTALFALFFYKNNTNIGVTVKQFYGSQSTYQRFSVPVNLGQVPDSLIIGCASSNTYTGVGVSPGSWLMLDKVQLINSTQQIPNNDLENWTTFNYEDPVGWSTLNPFLSYLGLESITKTTDSWSNTYALRLEALRVYDDTIGFATNGEIGRTGTKGGRPYTLQTDTLSGYYKYATGGVSQDTGAIGLEFSKNGTTFDVVYYPFLPTSTYTYFEVPINLGQQPDTLKIDINATLQKVPGSVLHLDGLKLTSQPVSLMESQPKHDFKVFPNPARDRISVQLNSAALERLKLVSVSGEVLKEKRISTAENTINMKVADLSKGIYFLEVIDKDGGSKKAEKVILLGE